MATVEGLRAELTAEFQKMGAMQAEQQAKIQTVTDAQAGWKIDTEGRMIRQYNQQTTLESKVSELIARLEKLEKSGVGPSSGAAGGKDRWQLTRPKE